MPIVSNEIDHSASAKTSAQTNESARVSPHFGSVTSRFPATASVPESVLLVGPHPGDRLESIERFTNCLQRELSDLAVKLIAPRRSLSRFAKGSAAKWLSYFEKSVLFRRQLATHTKNARTVAHFCDAATAWHLPAVRSQALLTCYDVLAIRSARGEFPHHATRWTGRQYQSALARAIERAPRIAAISDATARDLQRALNVPAERVRVIPMGLHTNFSPMDRSRAAAVVSEFIPSTPFILHVGGNQWYKNRDGVLRIFAQFAKRALPTPNLVLVGKALTAEQRTFIRTNDLTDRVFCLSHCHDEQLRAFYSAASLLLFPSLHEGFGWPILEAQACGCRVVTSNREPMCQLGGTAAALINPEDFAEAVGIINDVLNESAAESNARIQAGFENARLYSTERMIAGYRQYYTEIANAPMRRERTETLAIR